MKTPFPRTGQYFGVIIKNIPNHTHNDAIMVCLASDLHKIAYKIAAESYLIDRSRIYYISRDACDFTPISRAMRKFITRSN